MGKIGGLFGRSVMGPIAEHNLKCQSCVDALERVLAGFIRGDDVAAQANEILQMEQEADVIKNEIRRHMTRSVWGAVERAEVTALLGKQDNIADGCAKVALVVAVRRTPCPEEIGDILTDWMSQVHRYTDILVTEAKQAYNALENPSGGARARDVHEGLDSLGAAASLSDEMPQAFLKKLFRGEESLDPVSIMMLMTLSEGLQEITTAVANAAEALQRLLKIKQ